MSVVKFVRIAFTLIQWYKHWTVLVPWNETYFCVLFLCRTLPLTVFTRRNFVADYIFDKSRLLYEKRPFCVFDPLWGLEAGYDDDLRLIGKRVVAFY